MTTNQSSGGKARAERLSPEERKAIAAAGAAARWAKSDPDRHALPKAEYGSADRPLRIGEIEIPCFVLDDERRVLSSTGMQDSIQIARGGSMKAGMSRLELFVDGDKIKPFVSNELRSRVQNPIIFITPSGAKAYGYEADLLVELCETVLAYRASGKMMQQQLHIAQRCEMLVRGLARVGIVALVDEATGFQEARKRDALHKILEAYIAPDLMPWTRRFPPIFYEEMFRLHGWPYDPASVSRPGVVGKFTNQFVYEQLPPGVLDELRRRNPKDEETGYRKARLHQFLTDSIGHPHLERQITKTITLMQASDTWPMFKRLFGKVFQTKGTQIDLLPD